MPCCKAERYEWCKDLPSVYTDDEGEEYCVFHAPQGKKKVSVEKFNRLVFEKIDKARKSNAECNLQGTVFEGHISFSQFDKDNPLPEISFYEATFTEDADFNKVIFSEKANFSRATFKEAIFIEATFSKETKFWEAAFNEEANFIDTRFNGVVTFTQAKFDKNAFFSGATFSTRAYFTDTNFSKEADFMSAVFKKQTYFLKSRFNEKATFLQVEFNKETYFAGVTFREQTIFCRSTFHKQANFRETTFNKSADFAEIVIAEKIKFEGVNLSPLSFIDTDLTKIDFINCEWHKSHGRNVLYDEISIFRSKDKKMQEDGKARNILNRFKQGLKQWLYPDRERIKKVEILYRQLKRKCKEDHNDIDISDWHYGEKEMVRKSKCLRRILSLYSLYWLSSGYGERPRRAGIVLICLILLISVLFGFAGLIPDLELKQKLTLEPINGIKDFVKNPFEVLVNTLQYATFEKDTYFMPQNIWGIFLKILAKLFIPLQAALFAFSVRNRFKR